MARSPIQSKKQDIKSSRGGGGGDWKQRKEGLDNILGNIGGSS